MTIGGFPVAIGELKVATIAKRKELSDYTDLLCPTCNAKPSWKGGYECACGQKFNHWSKLKRVFKGTVEAVVMPRLKTEKGSTPAQIFRMSAEIFKQYIDAGLEEYGAVPVDEISAKNIRKLLIATTKLGQVIILRFNDIHEERIALLGTNLTGRIIIREITPMNLVEVVETMRVSMDNITEQELTEAELFVKQLPEATEDTLLAHDYRAKITPKAEVTAKVLQLEEILAKVPTAA